MDVRVHGTSINTITAKPVKASNKGIKEKNEHVNGLVLSHYSIDN